MAWNKESKASRRARVAKQLRDKHGKWIEMGGGVKWFKDGKWHDGTASAFVGNNVEVTMKDGSKQLVNHREIEPIRSKGSLGAKPEKPTGSVQAKKSTKGAKAATVRDNDPAKRLTSNAADLEEGDEVYLTTSNGKNGYGLSDEEAAKREDEGFEVHLDDKDEPKRARVVDTSGDKVIVEDSDGKRSEISKNDNVLQDDQEMDAALQNSEESSEKASLELPLEGLDLSDEDKKKINEAKTKEEAIAALAETDAAEYLPLARQNKNKAFVDAYRKAIADINEKHAASEEEAPKEEGKKASGTPQAALEKTAANLAEDIADIDSQKLEKEPEDVALDEATYDVKNDAGEEFLLTPKRGEEPGTWALDVKDSNGNVLETLPLEDQKPEEFAQAIKNSIEKNQSSKDSDAPSDEPEAPEDKPEADEAPKEEPKEEKADSDEKIEEEPKEEAEEAPSDEPPLKKALKDAGFTDEDIEKIENAEDETEADKQFFQSPSGKKASDKQIADKKSSPEYVEAQKAFKDFKAEKFPNDSDDKVRKNQEDRARREQEDSSEARAERAKDSIDRRKERDEKRKAENTDEKKLAEIDRKIAVGEKMIDDAKKKDNEPLAERIQENVDNLKKQREKLAPSEKTDEAPAEESNSSAVGEPFDSPENGVAILADKTLKKTEAGSMKIGDKFFARRIDEGKFAGKLKPISGSDVRVKPDGESWEIKDIKKDGAKGSIWEVEDSQGNKESITVSQAPEYDQVARRGSIVTDTAENREKMGLKPKTEKSEEKDAPASEEKAQQKAPTREEIVEAFDKLEADAGKISGSVDEVIAQTKPQPLGNGMSLKLGRNKSGDLGYAIQDEDGKEVGFAPFNASDKNRADAVLEAMDAKMAEPETSDSEDDPETKGDSDSAPSEEEAPAEEAPTDETPSEEKKEDADESAESENAEEEQKLVEEAKEEIEQELESEESSEPTPNVKSTIDEALQDIEDEMEETDWETLKERTWPVVGMEEDLFIGIAKGSTEDDKFLGLYDKDDNELETYDMKGLVNDIDERERNRDGADDGRDDSGGGSLDRGTGDDGAGDSGRDEASERARVVEESQSLVDEVKRDDGEAEGELRQLDDDGYSLGFEPNERSGRQQYVLRDPDNNVIARFGRKDEDKLAEKISRWRDAHRELRRAFSHDKDSEDRNVTPTQEMQRAAAIGTRFTKDDTTYTKISPVSWGYAKRERPNDIEGVLGRTTFNAGPGEYKLGHTDDDHKSGEELDNMSDDELKQAVAELDAKIFDVIAKDGPIGDKGNMGRRVTDDDQEMMQRLRFQALVIHEEAKQYSQRLWDRQKGDVLNAAPVDTGEFTPKKPETNYDGTIMGEAWQKLRNEYVGLDHRTLKHNYDLRNSEKPSRGAVAWGKKMDKWAGSSTLLDDAQFYRSVLASPETTAQFKPGSVFVDKGVMSVGGDQQLAEIYLQNREPRTAGKVPTVFTIEAPKGAKITLADQYDEGEYVIPSNAKLFISSAEEDENGILRVTARLNPSDEQIAEWTNKSTSSDTETPTDVPETPESTPEAMEPETISGESPSATPDTISGETSGLQAGSVVDHPKHGRGTIARMEGNGKYARVNFDKYDDPKKTFGVALSKLAPTGETKTPDGPADNKTIVFPGESAAAVGAWKIGERVNHGKHGVGTIQRLEGNGEFARVHFDKDGDNPKRTYGVKLTKLGKGESGTPSSIKDPSTKVEDQKPKQKVNSGTTETRNVQTNAKGEKFILGKNDAELYVGATIIHPKFGRGKVVKLENNGKYARVVFDNDPTNTPRGIVGARLEDASIEKEVDRTGFVEKPTKK